MILHIPHSSRIVPDDCREDIVLDDSDLQSELLRMTDAYTDEIFLKAGCQAAIYEVSRLIVDPERFVDDPKEPMVLRGMGVIYTRTSHDEILRAEPSPDVRRDLLDRFYYPHHRRLAQLVQQELDDQRTALIVDCHSFPSRPLPCDLDQNEPRPDICLGTDDYHTPQGLLKTAETAFAFSGLRVSINEPYKGTMVPAEYYGSDPRVWSIMIEIRRGLYMNESSGDQVSEFETVQHCISGVLEQLTAYQQEAVP